MIIICDNIFIRLCFSPGRSGELLRSNEEQLENGCAAHERSVREFPTRCPVRRLFVRRIFEQGLVMSHSQGRPASPGNLLMKDRCRH